MSRCLQCTKEIPLGAERCPYCTGNPNEGKAMGLLELLVVAVVFLIVFIYIMM
jgi:hypothetical protein